MKSLSWGVRRGPHGDGGPLSCSSAGCISTPLYNYVKGALPVAPSLLTGPVGALAGPCPLSLYPSSLSILLSPFFWRGGTSLGSISPSLPRVIPIVTLTHQWHISPPHYFDTLFCQNEVHCAAVVVNDVTSVEEPLLVEAGLTQSAWLRPGVCCNKEI